MKKFLKIVVLGLLLSSCAALESPVTSGMHKHAYCGAKNLGAFSAICNKRYVYFKDGIEVLKQGNTYAVFKDVTDPTTSTFSENHQGDGTFVEEVIGWEAAQKSINNLSQKNTKTKEIEIASMIEKAKSTCKSLGFNEGTDKFSDCTLKLYTQSVELAAEQNKKVVMQPQSSGSNVMTIYDPARESRVLINKGQRMISGACTLGIDC